MYRPVFLAVLLATLFQSGCHRQWVSIGDMPVDSGWHGEQRGIGVWFDRTDFLIGIKASNLSHSWDPTKQEFALSLRFYPKESGFLFDPRQVRLVLPGAGEVVPRRIEMVANAAGWESSWQCSHGPRQNKLEQIVSLGREVCFEFFFPISPPSPAVSFAFQIHGLSRNGKLVKTPEVQFTKGSFWVWDFLGR